MSFRDLNLGMRLRMVIILFYFRPISICTFNDNPDSRRKSSFERNDAWVSLNCFCDFLIAIRDKTSLPESASRVLRVVYYSLFGSFD